MSYELWVFQAGMGNKVWSVQKTMEFAFFKALKIN